MRSRATVLALLILGLAAAATAAISSEVPVSSISARSQRTGRLPAVASSGSEYLVTWLEGQGPTGYGQTWDVLARRFTADGQPIDTEPLTVFANLPAPPAPQIAYGDGRYVIAAYSGYGVGTLRLAIVEKLQVVRSWTIEPEDPRNGPGPGNPHLAWNGRAFLLTHDGLQWNTIVRLLDRDGQTLATTNVAGGTQALASDGSDFLAITTTTHSNPPCAGACIVEAFAQPITAAGTALAPKRILLADSSTFDRPNAMALAWNGSIYAAVWFGGPTGAVNHNELRATELTPDGTVVGPVHTVVSDTPPIYGACLLMWTGADFVAMGQGDRTSSALYRVSMALDSATRVDLPGDEATIGAGSSNFLLVWSDGNFTPLPLVKARVLGPDLLADPARPDLFVTTLAAPRQQVPAIAGDDSQRLVVWREGDSDYQPATLHAARIDASGLPLDDLQIGTVNGSAGVAVASSGRGYLVVWAAVKTIRVRTVGRDGALGETVDLPAVSPAAILAYPEVTWAGTNYIVVWTAFDNSTTPFPGSDAHVMAQRVGADGFPLDATALTISHGAGQQLTPSIAWNGTTLLAAWQKNVYSGCEPGSCSRDDTSVEVAVLSASGVPAAAVSLGGQAQRPRVASDGRDFLVVWANPTPFPDQSSIVAERVSASGQPIDPEPIAIADGSVLSQNPVVAGFNADGFLVAYERGERNLTSTQQSDIVGSLVGSDGVVRSSFPLAATSDLEITAAVVGSGSSFAVAYVRYTHEVEYGGAARVFYRPSNPPGRVRVVRR